MEMGFDGMGFGVGRLMGMDLMVGI